MSIAPGTVLVVLSAGLACGGAGGLARARKSALALSNTLKLSLNSAGTVLGNGSNSSRSASLVAAGAGPRSLLIIVPNCKSRA